MYPRLRSGFLLGMNLERALGGRTVSVPMSEEEDFFRGEWVGYETRKQTVVYLTIVNAFKKYKLQSQI